MIESRSPRAPHQSNLLKFTSYVAHMCFWLVVVFELPVGGHIRQRRFIQFFYLIRNEETPPPTRADDAAVDAAPSQATSAVAAACSSRRRQVAQLAPAPPAATSHRPPNPHPLRFCLVGGHRGISAHRLERGAPRRIPRPHRAAAG